MSLAAISLNHRNSPVELRERLAFPENEIGHAAENLARRIAGGAVILSTCNRVELYAHSQDAGESLADDLMRVLAESRSIPCGDFDHNLRRFDDVRAVAGHLFRVASSLDSLVVGESQILGQVHSAYVNAQTVQATDKVLNGLFQRAFSVAKDVRTQTTIGAGKVSISSVAVDLAESIFRDLADKTVMVVGSGEMARLTIENLLDRGVGKVLVVNRSMDRARAAAEQYGGEVIGFDRLGDELHRADIVISSTAAPHCVLHPAQFTQALRRRDQQPVFVIDIAVPRDVEAAVGELDNVYLYDVDDLERVVETNLEARLEDMERGLAIVDHGVEQFVTWYHGLAAEPTLVSMADEVEALRKRELDKTLSALPELTEDQRAQIAYLTKRLTKNILQHPMREIKREIGHHDPHMVLHLVRKFFGLAEH